MRNFVMGVKQKVKHYFQQKLSDNYHTPIFLSSEMEKLNNILKLNRYYLSINR